jgi:transposase
MHMQTYLHCAVPRSNCTVHDVLTIAVPWAAPHSRWTQLFEAFALRIIEHTSTITKACALLDLNWHQVHTIKRRAVERGLQRRDLKDIEYLGIDEKNFGTDERFVTILSDLTNERVLEVAPSKSNEAAEEVFDVLTDAQRAGVQAVAMDMSAGYESVSRQKCPSAEPVYDKFYVEEKLSKGVDTVRRAEHKELVKKGITIFSKTRYLWLSRPERWKEYQQEQFAEIEAYFGKWKVGQTRIGRAWTLKEAFRPFW